MNNNTYVLYGASGHCKVIMDIIILNDGEVEFIVDDDNSKKELLGVKVVSVDALKHVSNNLIISIGRNQTRKRIVETLNSNIYTTLIHPSSIIDSTAQIKEGSVVMPGTVINASTIIGKHCIINTSASIDHDCIIDDFVHISPNATLCGSVSVGSLTHIGAGSVVIQGIEIGNNVTIGAGSVIISNIPDNCVVVGNPGRIIKMKE